MSFFTLLFLDHTQFLLVLFSACVFSENLLIHRGSYIFFLNPYPSLFKKKKHNKTLLCDEDEIPSAVKAGFSWTWLSCFNPNSRNSKNSCLWEGQPQKLSVWYEVQEYVLMELGVHRENPDERVTQPTMGICCFNRFLFEKWSTVKVLYLNISYFWRNTGIFLQKTSAPSWVTKTWAFSFWVPSA